MKKLSLFVFIYAITLTSCEDELCYNCINATTGDTSNFCLARPDAHNQKVSLENAGYTCKKQ